MFSLLVCFMSTYMLQAQQNKNAISFVQLQQNISLSNSSNSTRETVMDNYKPNKYERFKKLRNSGIVLTCVGAGLITGGIVLIASGANDVDNYNNGYGYYDDDAGAAKVAGGALCVVLGGMSTGGGITMWAIGSRKMKKYANVSIQSTKNGLALAYKF